MTHNDPVVYDVFAPDKEKCEAYTDLLRLSDLSFFEKIYPKIALKVALNVIKRIYFDLFFL
jgi:hypothetical protein